MVEWCYSVTNGDHYQDDKGTFLDWRSKKARDPARDGIVAISQSCHKEEYHIKISRQTFIMHCIVDDWIQIEDHILDLIVILCV